MSRKVALNFAILPFRGCKRPSEADMDVTGGALLSVLYSYAARVRLEEPRANHLRKRDALTVKSTAVLYCAPKWIPTFFSRKRAIAFERLCTGMYSFPLSAPAHFDDIVNYLPSLVRCDKSCAQPPASRLPRRRRCLFSARCEDADGCSPLATKMLMPVHHLPAPICHDDMHAYLCACALPRCHRRPSVHLISPRCYLCQPAVRISVFVREAQLCRNANIRFKCT